MKRVISGVIMLMMVATIAFASGLTQQISVVFNQVNISVNGKKVQADNILYNGTTYVPLRAVAEALGKDVGWDAATNTAGINDKTASTKQYTTITVDGGDMSGTRQANVKVDVGYGDRVYWAYTNEYGQLVKVTADKIILQDPTKEKVLSNGRYYADEANVPGTEKSDLDKGHVIADSLGGVSNAYNITPQDSTLNRHGDQAYMEENIRKAGGCTDFTAIITYPDTTTQIPSHYSYTYTLKGNVIHDEFDNINPDVVNKSLNENQKVSSTPIVVPKENTTSDNITNVETAYVGNSATMKFHKASCTWATKTSEENRVCFKTREEAIAKGYVACKVCNP